MKYKVILSLPLARRLLSKGFHIIDVEPSHRRKGKLAFIFEFSEELDAEMTRYAKDKHKSKSLK